MVSHPKEEPPSYRPPSHHHQPFAPHAPGLPPPLNNAPPTTHTYSPHTHLDYHHHPPPSAHGYPPHASLPKEEHSRPCGPYTSPQDSYHSPHQGSRPPPQGPEFDPVRRSPPRYGRYAPGGPGYATTSSAPSGNFPAPVAYTRPPDPASPRTGRPPLSAGPEPASRPPHVEREEYDRRLSMDYSHGHYAPHPQQHTLAEHLEHQSASQHSVPPPQGPPGPPPTHVEHHIPPGYPPHVSHLPPPPPGHWNSPQYAAYYDTANGQGAQQRRKAVRAAQACDNCRAKKAKCDENRPTCGNCEQQQIACNYRTVPPPKLDRTYQTLSHAFESAKEESQQMFRDEMNKQTQVLIQALQSVSLRTPSELTSGFDTSDRSFDHLHSPTPPSTFAPSLQNRHMSNDNVSYMNPYRSTLPRNLQPSRGSTVAESVAVKPLRPIGQNPDSQVEDKHAQIREDATRDCLEGQLSIPAVHTTAAHEMRSWLGNDNFFQGVSPRYVMEGESRHHLIFSAWPRVASSNSRGLTSSPAPGQSPLDDASISSGSSSSRPAAAFVIMGGVAGSRGANPTPGGRNKDQSLSVDEATAHRLRKSYFHNIHIVQPFMDKVQVMKMVNDFVDEYCCEPVVDVQWHNYARHDDKKRKFNETRPSGPPGRVHPIQRSVENAVVLLVFALGRVSEHKGRLPPPVGQEGMGSTRIPSTTSTPTTRQAFSVPLPDGRSPRFADDHYSYDFRNHSLNMDRLPGAAYFSHAVSILGENVGGNTLLHVQASLLAGLYLAQFAFVYDSWKWINIACVAWLMLLKEKDDNVNSISLQENLTFWTCLIMESDILAELKIIPSGVSTLEDMILPPAMIDSANQALDGEDIEIREHFLAQIHVRKILNRAHSALYQAKTNAAVQVRSKWATLNSDELAEFLEEWRQALPPRLRWSDSDEPARSILLARLRAKYYGARNIIFRPFLHRVITSKLPENMGPPEMDHQQRLENETKTFANALHCIEAVKRSTVAFDNVDGMPERLVVTNIFGTAHAQWGNCLVLGAACQSEKIDQTFTPKDFRPYLDRTINFLSNLAQLSPTMETNLQILHQVKRHFQQTQPSSAHSSFIAE